MFNEKVCPYCMSSYQGNKCKNCGYTENTGKSGLRFVWKFIIVFVLFQLILGTVLSNFIRSFILTFFAWGVLLSIPCIIRYGIKRIFNKKNAIIYTVLSAIILFFANVFISVIVNQTVTLWNLIMMAIPYYILTDDPLFGRKKVIQK